MDDMWLQGLLDREQTSGVICFAYMTGYMPMWVFEKLAQYEQSEARYKDEKETQDIIMNLGHLLFSQVLGLRNSDEYERMIFFNRKHSQ